MMVFQWLDPRLAADSHHGESVGLWGPIAHSFHLSMLPMGLVFGVIGALIAAFYACFRLTLTAQRDRLAEQAEMLKRNNEELARLELANRRTSQFMAHDFKTSLGCVAGFTTQLLEQPQLQEDRDVASALVCIRRQAHGMMGSVADLLEFSRVREGREPRMKPTSVAELLQEAVSDFSLPAHTERLTLGEQYRSCPSLLADPRLLRRVLCNLIANAIKHNGPDTQVRLDAQVAESRTEVLFTCCDDGAGIPQKLLPSLFTEFTTTGDPSSESTGLGLAFCRTVVGAHGGRIWCENLEQGARFLFTVPLVRECDNDK
jgi:signal transduction histidine kinase